MSANTVDTALAEIARLQAINGELVAACKAVVAVLTPMGFYGPEYERLAAAIAKAEAKP